MLSKGLKIVLSFYDHYKAVKKFGSLTDEEKNSSPLPNKFTEDLVSFGPLFVKLGQILSTRPDILPNEYIKELETLHENVPAFEFSRVQKIVEQELEQPINKTFQFFEKKPVASASLAQVHYAILQSGEEVALKIQRPQVDQSINNDLRLLKKILRVLKMLFPRKIKKTNLDEGFKEFSRYTLQELDFAHEANTIDRFRSNFREWDDILFPKVYWEYTTRRVLTMERLSGMRLNEVIVNLPKEEKERINTRLVEMELKMFITDGLFHADLHPGNIFFREDGKIILLDFGMYGELNGEERNRFVLYWMDVSQNKVKKAFYHFRKQCRELPGADEKAFYNRFKELADRFYHSRLRDVSITKVYINMIEAGYKHGYLLPGRLLLHAKALTTAEALTFNLAPDARFEEITRPLISREFARLALNGENVRSKIEQLLPELLLMGKLPQVPTDNETGGNNSENFWQAIYDQLIQNIKEWSSGAGIFKQLLNSPSKNILRKNFSHDVVEQILGSTWKEFLHLEPGLPKQQALGANFTIRLAAVTIALYKALISAGENKESAIALIYNIGWKVYKKMADIPMLIAGGLSDDPYKRMVIATQIFRIFPFSEPDYGWEDVESAAGTVAFNCTSCQVAKLFIKNEIGDVCYGTWCQLDFPLAEYWGGRLERTNSIAGGASVCDFRFIAKKTDPTTKNTS